MSAQLIGYSEIPGCVLPGLGHRRRTQEIRRMLTGREFGNCWLLNVIYLANYAM